MLWEQMIGILADELPKGVKASDISVLFAGGIQDATSAAMVVTAQLVASRSRCAELR